MEDVRGIMRPAAVGPIIGLQRTVPPPDLAEVIDGHWIVRWDLRGRAAFRSEVMTHPSVHLVFEPEGAFVYGVRRKLDSRVLEGAGWAVGTKFLPGGFAELAGGPVDALTDRRVELSTLFGDPGAALARAAAQAVKPDAKLALLHAFLRPRLSVPDADGTLARAAAAMMRDAPPRTTVDDVADALHVSTRTLQRLFRRQVGVGPKWVLQRYRLHDTIEQLDTRDGADWTRFALDLGYFDHAHFIRDFRAVAGRSPATYEREAAELRQRMELPAGC